MHTYSVDVSDVTQCVLTTYIGVPGFRDRQSCLWLWWRGGFRWSDGLYSDTRRLLGVRVRFSVRAHSAGGAGRFGARWEGRAWSAVTTPPAPYAKRGRASGLLNCT